MKIFRKFHGFRWFESELEFRVAGVFFVLIFSLYQSEVLGVVTSYNAKLVLIDESNQRHELSGRQCKAGVYLSRPTQFKCVCVHGVWGMYGNYCDAPIAVVAGENYCFKMPPNTPVSQFIIFGNPSYPFEGSITHFRDQFKIFTKFYAIDENNLDLDAASSFITITEHFWEITSDKSEVVCLSGLQKKAGEKQVCRFSSNDWTFRHASNWSFITGLDKGCRPSTNIVQQATECIPVPSNPEFPKVNGIEVCTGETIQIEQNTTIVTTEDPIIDFNTFLPSTTTPTSSTTATPIPIILKPDSCLKGFTRDDVKDYWQNSKQNTNCPKSTTNAVFLDQLRRFAVLKMSKLFNTRTRSLEQMSTLLILIRDVMGRTCPEKAVSGEFLDVVIEIFTMFIKEDFFYGVEELEPAVFERFKFVLTKCAKRAQPFVFSMKSRECDFNEITGTVFLPSGDRVIDIPPGSSSANFEPLIEAVWKMFLNVHAFCYQDFLQINDHHHFSTILISLFTKTIYEKWVSPLDSEDLYKFIVPNTNFLAGTLRNIDYCVGATNFVSSCPPWLHRHSRQSPLRKKRNVWATQILTNRKKQEIWKGAAYCLQRPEEPGFKLGFGRCPTPI